MILKRSGDFLQVASVHNYRCLVLAAAASHLPLADSHGSPFVLEIDTIVLLILCTS